MASKRPANDAGGSEGPPAKKSSLTSIKPLNLGAIYSLTAHVPTLKQEPDMSALTKRHNSTCMDAYRLLCGTCPEEECQAKLYFLSYDKSIECTNCGQRHEMSLLQNVAEVTGLSNYVCKLISPMLTNYGMDRKLGKARLLKDMGHGEVFNCGQILGDIVFLIEEENLDVIGYGKDRSGSIHYLADTLNDIRSFNDNETRLIPIHVDGDGHCLVHAISRALVGRELFWHALRVNLGLHIRDNLASYKQLFKDFINAEEWEDIIDECDPYYIPPEGEPIGLRNIHIFGLANVLHRPIILLDSKSGMQSPGDYSGRGPAMLPAYMVQTAWGMPEESIKNYLELGNMDRCVVGGDKCLTDRYIRQLGAAMEEVFIEQNQVHPNLVADVHQFIYKYPGIVCVQPDEVIQRTQQSVRDEVLYRCLTCEALVEYHLDKLCSFPMQGAVCSYNAERECIPDMTRSHPNTCAFCSGEMLRLVKADGGILYKDGDRTTTPCVGGKCSCGYKHFWQGKEYDNLPELFSISLQWAGKELSEKVAWFQYETNPTMNSNVFDVAQWVVQKHFPGEFGSERLVQQVVDTILGQTAAIYDTEGEGEMDNEDALSADTASNIILTGPADSSIQSKSNGTVDNEPGIKFERLKNLQEDDLLSKIRDIMGHLERLEDYHRGDGMRMMKMLDDMYWDYPALRETIGDTMALGGYAPVSMKMLESLDNFGMFMRNEEVWHLTYYTYTTMCNFTDSSSKLAQALAENDAVRLLMLNCGHKPYINAIYNKNVRDVIEFSLIILLNISRNHGMKRNQNFDEIKISEILDEGALPLFLKMLLHGDVREQTSAARVVRTLAFDKEVRQKIIDFPDIVATLKKCADSTNKSLHINSSGALSIIEPGFRSEWMQNLEEDDDQLSKIREIIGHLERLEDYHSGDGMYLQFILHNMYHHYTPLRESIGDRMALCGYAPVSMKMLTVLMNSIGIFKKKDVWFATFYTYDTMCFFTDSSPKLAQKVFCVIESSLSILYNISRNHGMKHFFDENKTSETIMPFLKSEDKLLCILATLIIANIVDKEENTTRISETGTVHSIVTWTEKALNQPGRRYNGFTPQKLTDGLNKLAVNDSNKMRILDEGALPLFLKMLLHDDLREQTSAARVIGTLAFDKKVRQKIIDFPGIVATLKEYTDSTNISLQINASDALSVIGVENDVIRESRPISAKMKSHDEETVLYLRESEPCQQLERLKNRETERLHRITALEQQHVDIKTPENEAIREAQLDYEIESDDEWEEEDHGESVSSDQAQLDYEIESDDEWEEEDPVESVSCDQAQLDYEIESDDEWEEEDPVDSVSSDQNSSIQSESNGTVDNAPGIKFERLKNLQMSEMEDDHRTLSRHLWRILDGIGLFPEKREVVTNAAVMVEILGTLRNSLTGDKETEYVAGSSYEATTTDDLQSDRDHILIDEKYVVLEDLQSEPQDAICLLLVRDNTTPAGYTKLRVVKNGSPRSFDPKYSVDIHGKVWRNNIQIPDQIPDPDCEINGPARTFTDSDGDVDTVAGYRCASWPGVARKWRTRVRHHNWPMQDQIQKLCEFGCFVVGVGHPHSPEVMLEWRISFSLQERDLMVSLNDTQYKIYVLMKVIKKDFITSKYQDSISSYHCKTVLFYAIESTPAEFWVPENLVTCLLHCLKAMYTCAVDGVCPSYFIPEANLFDSKIHGELREQIVSLLNELLRENGKFLFGIRCDNIGIQLSAASNTGAPHTPCVLLDCTGMLLDSCLVADTNIMIYVTDILADTDATSIETLQDVIARLVSTTRVTEHTESETREAKQYLLPHLHANLASRLAAGIVLPGSGNCTAGNMRTLMEEHVQSAISPGLTSCRLKVATIFYMLEDYSAAERLLSEAAAALSLPVVNVCPCICTGHISERRKHLPNTLDGCKDFVNSHMCCCISFLSSEMAVTPASLQYEMFKSRRTPTLAVNWRKRIGRWWHEWSNVDPTVFLHYMQYLLYDKLGDVGRRQRALHDLIDQIDDEDDDNAKSDDRLHLRRLYHKETAYNLLGWIFKQEGDVIMAARYFLRSIRMQPEDNAAKWHIGDLYLRQSKASWRTPLASTLPMISY